MPETKRQLEDEIMELHEHVYDALLSFFNRYEEISRPQSGGYSDYGYETYDFDDFYPAERREEELRELTNERDYLHSLLERVTTASQNLEINRPQKTNVKPANSNAKPANSKPANAKPANSKPANSNSKPANSNAKPAHSNAKPANVKANSTTFAGVGGCGCRF